MPKKKKITENSRKFRRMFSRKYYSPERYPLPCSNHIADPRIFVIVIKLFFSDPVRHSVAYRYRIVAEKVKG